VVSSARVTVLVGAAVTALCSYSGVAGAVHGPHASDRPRGAASLSAACTGRWAAGTRGQPQAAPSGYRVWRDVRGWHLRTVSGAGAVRFVGRIETAKPLRSVRAVRLEADDAVAHSSRRILLRLSTRGRDLDGIDFQVLCGPVAFALGAEGTAWPARQIHVGARGRAPARSFVATDPAASGIEGRVMSGPDCPVEGVPECPGGNRRPVPATVVVKKSGGRLQTPVEVMSVTTNDQGRFRVDLPPGDYLLEPRSSDPSLQATPASAHVEPGLVTRVDMLLGTGLS
jgi:hypothetical protein